MRSLGNLLLFGLLVLISCSSGTTNSPSPPPSADFSLSISPTTLSISAGQSQTLSVNASASNGFSSTVVATVSGLPSGVTATPAALNLVPGTAQTLTLAAASSAGAATTTVTVNGVSGALSHFANLSLEVKAAPPPPPPPPPPPTGVDVTTYHFDSSRDGLNAQETNLTLANVNASSFGKVGFLSTDGKVDGQPLYLSQLTINGATHNVLYAVTEHDSVYAFDIDSAAVLWQKSVLGTNETPSDDHGCGQITPEIGITNTPVIDRSKGALYFVAMSKDGSGKYHQRLHALDLTNGNEIQGGPTEISASYPGTGKFSQNGMQVFDPGQYAERVGLLLLNGQLILGWTSHCDYDPYTGWLMMYDESTLKQTAVLNLTPNGNESDPHFQGGEGSIWQSGAGLAADSQGNVYFLSANGAFETTLDSNGFPSRADFGNSFLKVSSAGGKLSVADYFSPYNTADESVKDQDLGSGGVLVLPDVADSSGTTRHLAVGAGKDGNIYLVDRDNMGKFNSSSNQIYQELTGALSAVFGMPAYFNNTLYYGSVGAPLRAFPVAAGKLNTNPSSSTAVSFSYPGATPSISANGTQNGIVWAVESNTGKAAVLHAYDATDLSKELYNSNQASNGRDSFGNGNKFITPAVADGKVFVGTPTGVAVFGLMK